MATGATCGLSISFLCVGFMAHKLVSERKEVSLVASKCTVNKEFTSEVVSEDYFFVPVSSCKHQVGVWTSSLSSFLSLFVCSSVTLLREPNGRGGVVLVNDNNISLFQIGLS